MPTMNLFNEKQIENIEKHYNGNYIFDSCLKSKNGGWVNFPIAIFYTEKKHPEGSHYFGLFFKPMTDILTITNGISATEPFDALELINGKILYSRYRHDYRTEIIGDKQISIDGGRDYTKIVGDMNLIKRRVKMHVVKDKLLIMENNSVGNS